MIRIKGMTFKAKIGSDVESSKDGLTDETVRWSLRTSNKLWNSLAIFLDFVAISLGFIFTNSFSITQWVTHCQKFATKSPKTCGSKMI